MIGNISDIDVSRLIIRDYFEDLDNALESDVIIVGGGPSGMACAQFHGTCRMGPIFGGMLLSGKKAAGIAVSKLDGHR